MTKKEFEEKRKNLITVLKYWSTDEGADELTEILQSIIMGRPEEFKNKEDYFKYSNVFEAFILLGLEALNLYMQSGKTHISIKDDHNLKEDNTTTSLKNITKKCEFEEKRKNYIQVFNYWNTEEGNEELFGLLTSVVSGRPKEIKNKEDYLRFSKAFEVFTRQQTYAMFLYKQYGKEKNFHKGMIDCYNKHFEQAQTNGMSENESKDYADKMVIKSYGFSIYNI